MYVALHLDPDNPSKLLGVWAAPITAGEQPRHFYPTDADGSPSPAFSIGLDRMASWPSIRPRAGWEKWVRYLASRTPYTAWWEATEVDDDSDLEAIFVVESASRLAFAASIHGVTDSGFTATMLSSEDELMLAADWAGLTAQVFGGPSEKLKTPMRLSSRFDFRASDSTLLVGLTKRNPRAADAELALAYGLAHAGDRDLWIVLPEDLAEPTLHRAAFIETKVRVFTVGDDGPREQWIPSAAHVLAGPPDTIVTDIAVLGSRADWVTPLLAWAEIAPELVAAHRRSYLAWHCAGRLVLRIRRTHAGLEVAAGVQYSKPVDEQPTPTVVALDGPISAVDAHRVVGAAARAAADSLDGTDGGHAEHRLQAALQARHLALRNPLYREFPARRIGGQRAFIDFLGVSTAGDVHVVETKIGSDEMLVLQGLDYWIWVRRNLKQLIPFLGLRPTPRATIDFIVASPDGTGPAVGPYSAAQAEALTGEIRWRFRTVTSWQGSDVTIDTSTPSRSVPARTPRAYPEPRWAVRLGHHLATNAAQQGVTLRNGVFWPDPNDGLLPEGSAALDQLRRTGLDHKMVGHVRSSQAFALNLFAPLSDDALRAVWRRFGYPNIEQVERPIFEWSDPDDVLGEATAKSPHKTQIDVLLRATTARGMRVVALIEVKLSETDFGPCSAHDSTQNPHPQVCETGKPFGGLPELCFQLTNKNGSHRRRYDQYLDGIASTNHSGVGCPFRYGNQPMRNVALARSLVERGDADDAFVALCAPEAHSAIWRRWDEAKLALDGVSGVTLTDLPASAVLQYHVHEEADALGNRYLLDTRPLHALRQRHRAQLALDALFPNGAAYEHVDVRNRVTQSLLFPRPVVTRVTETAVEISSPPISYPLPLTFTVGPDAFHQATKQASNRPAELLLEGPDESGITRRLTANVSATGIDTEEAERVRLTVRADYFDFDFASFASGIR